MDELIRQELQQEANSCPVQSIPWDNIRNRAFNNAISNVPLGRIAVIRKIGYGFVVMVIIGGLLVGSGLISPVMARTLERISVIKAMFDFIRDSGLQNAIDKGFGTKVNRTASDKGILVAIADVLYDQGRLDIGYTVTTSRQDLGPEDYPGDMIIPLGSPGMQFFVNNKPIYDTAQGTCQKLGNGRVGLVEIYHRGDLPETFNLQIVIHQIGKQNGEWVLTVPVSRQRTDAATKVLLPMKAVTVGQTAILIKKIEIAPSSTIIEYELTQPVNGQLGWQNLPRPIDDKGNYLRGLTCYTVSKHIEENMKTEVIREIFETPKILPKYLVFVPIGADSIGYPTANIKVLLD
ncbi:MAG: DUF4179 domain-containing protein [Thermoanaerobacteraceae bacterium]|nr:DUF4179 domain-containing protein [Thermoanaerobacteraceae bacterium]